MKQIKAVRPYIYRGKINFKHKPYDAWIKAGGKFATSHYPVRALHKFAYDFDYPTICVNKGEARLRFVQPSSLTFDTFPDYMFYEIIPMFWDCWPNIYNKVCKFLSKHNVKTAIFTAEGCANYMRKEFPEMNILHLPEGVDTCNYGPGKLLKDRTVDLLEFGRDVKTALHKEVPSCLNYLHSKPGVYLFEKYEDFYDTMLNTKITIAYPRCTLQPEATGGLETLTQRYWEGMLTRMLMVGHAPKELVDIIGYNPVIELDSKHDVEQIIDILNNIDSYQSFVNKNREAALQYGDWNVRMRTLMNYLSDKGYKI